MYRGLSCAVGPATRSRAIDRAPGPRDSDCPCGASAFGAISVPPDLSGPLPSVIPLSTFPILLSLFQCSAEAPGLPNPLA
jgi:hypothetical protein